MTCETSIAAVGDISFAGRNADSPSLNVLSGVIPVLKESNLVIGNLESPLVSCGDPAPGKCTLHGDPGWAELMKDAGITLVGLANNHMMDYGDAGLFSTMRALDSVGINYVGAGGDIEGACAPLFLDIKEKRLAFLARTSVIVTSPSYAGAKQAGVALLDIEETKQKLKMCKNQSDIVILLVHWGLENYSYPSPNQRQMAEELIDAGADVILGHHPHVLQGMEQISNGMVAYSLGNFLFDEFEWTLNGTEIGSKKILSPLSRQNREAIILNLTWNPNGSFKINPIFTRVDEEARVKIDLTPYRDTRFKSLNKKLYYPFYKCWWHIYSMKNEWHVRIKPRLSWGNTIRKIHKLRIRHIKEFFGTFQKSAKIALGKTTNPYD